MVIDHYWSIYTVYSVLWRDKMYRCSHIDWQQNVFLTADDMDDIVAMMTFTGYGVHSQRTLGNLAQHHKLRSLSANQIGPVDGRSANCWSRNWRSKIHGKTKHSWSTINSEHQVNRRSVNRRSNLIWLVKEKPDLNLSAHLEWPHNMLALGQHILVSE